MERSESPERTTRSGSRTCGRGRIRVGDAGEGRKRERYAPSFHLDDENLDPKTWCRFPILSGGFTRELAELREQVASDAVS